MKNLINLIQIKKLIALALTLVFCILALRKDITAEQLISIYSLAVGFYFGQSSVRQAIKEKV